MICSYEWVCCASRDGSRRLAATMEYSGPWRGITVCGREIMLGRTDLRYKLYLNIVRLVSRASPYHNFVHSRYHRSHLFLKSSTLRRGPPVSRHPLIRHIMCIERTLLEYEFAVVVLNPLSEVKVTGSNIAVDILQVSAKNRDIRTALNGEVDVLSGPAEVLAVPVEVAYEHDSC